MLDSTKYDQIVTPQLPDASAYSPIHFGLDTKCGALIKRCVGTLVKSKLLASKRAAVLLLYADTPATRYFYGLPKTQTGWKVD